MSSRQHKEDLFIAQYTLGLLEPNQLAQAHALLGQDDAAAACALQWEERLLDLTDALTPLHPSDQLLGRIQATLGLPLGKQSLGTAANFEPRLIRPDSTTAASAASAAPASVVASASAAPPAKTEQSSEPLTQSSPAPSKPTSPAPSESAFTPSVAKDAPRVRVAPPDPAEALRPKLGSHKTPGRALWRSLWFWRTLSAALAVLAAVLVLPKNSIRHDPALNASLQPPVAPATQIVQVAVMQAPGTSSTPGWILTVDSRQNVVLAPQVNIVVPELESVYLWTYNEHSPQPRLLGSVDPTQSLTLPIEVTGEVRPGQIFEMTQEPSLALPREPDGPILFIGRTVSLG